MANALFTAALASFLTAGNSWASDHRFVLVDEGTDTPVPATDDFLDDIAAGARVAVSGALQNPTSTGGVADADDITISAVTGATVESLVCYQHTGTDSTSELVLYIDTATGLTYTPNGSDVNLIFDSGANKIFKL